MIVTNEQIQQYRDALDKAPDITEMFGETFGDYLTPLYQCKESYEWLFWNGFEWASTDLERGEVLIPVSVIRTILAQHDEIHRLREALEECAAAGTREEACKIANNLIGGGV